MKYNHDYKSIHALIVKKYKIPFSYSPDRPRSRGKWKSTAQIAEEIGVVGEKYLILRVLREIIGSENISIYKDVSSFYLKARK